MMSLINKAEESIRQQEPERKLDTGMHVTKDGDGALQAPWGEFDSHRLQVIAFVPQLVQEEPCKFSFVSSTLTEGCGLITQLVEYAPLKRLVVGSNPTGVSCRLIVQRKEHLASNEKVLGSNPSKAKLSDVDVASPSSGARSVVLGAVINGLSPSSGPHKFKNCR